MREDPYPARFYGRQVDEPFLSEVLASLPNNHESAIVPFQQPLPRVFLLLMTLYLCCALFLIFTVSSYAAPLGSATIPSKAAAGCLEFSDTTIAAAH
jgi:hypothetical protein